MHARVLFTFLFSHKFLFILIIYSQILIFSDVRVHKSSFRSSGEFYPDFGCKQTLKYASSNDEIFTKFQKLNLKLQKQI